MTLEITENLSPNFNDRRDQAKPEFLILHYTGTLSAEEAQQHYLNTDPNHFAGPVSPHYMIDEKGHITRFVPEDKRAWHAGASYWDGKTDINSLSIGIELVNPGHENGYQPFPEAQIETLIKLCKDILGRHDIPPHQVLGHSDIAPARKKDPGELLPWALLAENGIGLWPAPTAKEKEESQTHAETADKLLEAYGYDPKEDTNVLIKAFQRHFHTELFERQDDLGQLTEETLARLYNLTQQKNSLVC